MHSRTRQQKKKPSKPVRKSKRSSEQRRPKQELASTPLSNPTAKKIDAEIRKVLQEGIRQTGPHSQRFMKRATALGELLNGWQLYNAGKITEFSKQSEELQKKYPFLKLIPPPEWATPRVAFWIVAWIRAAENQHPGAAAQFITWLRKMFSEPRGRPVDLTLVPIAREAARLHAKGQTWGQVALKLCPRRNEENHDCYKNRCGSRIRNLVKQSGLSI